MNQVVDLTKGKETNLEELIKTVEILRSENGCQWDREQTHYSLRPNMIEEAYEAVDAIDDNDMKHLREELGDVLFSVVNLCRKYHVKPQDALNNANTKFIKRFNLVYKLAQERNLKLESLTPQQWDSLWEEAKNSLKALN